MPAIPPAGCSWQSIWTANPDLLEHGDDLLLFYRGNGVMPGRDGAHDRIGLSRVLFMAPGVMELRPLNGDQPIVDVGADGDFDGEDALDPAAIFFKGTLFLYYSAIGDGPDSVGLVTSGDMTGFTKYGKVMDGRAPDVVVMGDKLLMVYQRPDAAGNYQVFLAESDDGFNFRDVVHHPVLSPTKDSWDSLSLATVRLSKEGDTVYAIYGGSSYLADEPDFFGLARSKNLVDWEYHPGNPVFGCGQKGAPDGGAIWFPALYETPDDFVMLYEGSRGKYSWDLSSAICMASIPKG